MPQAVSFRYAKALADAVLDPAAHLNADQIRGELATFEQLFAANSDLRNVLLSPAVPPARKRAVVARLGAELPLSRIAANFLFVLIDRRRIGILSDVRQAFETELDARLGIVRAEVTSAAGLDEADRRELEGALGRITGKQIRAEYSVDAALIGGAVARIGTTIYDGSVRGQLNSLRTRLVS